MKRLTVRLDDLVHERLMAELKKWRIARGPKFSLNDLCSEKLNAALPVTKWAAVIKATKENS